MKVEPSRFALFMVVGREGEEDREGLQVFWPSAWKHPGMGVERGLGFRLGGL